MVSDARKYLHTYQYMIFYLLAASFCLYTAWLLIEMLHPGYSRFHAAPA
jgi:hypothetical protein